MNGKGTVGQKGGEKRSLNHVFSTVGPPTAERSEVTRLARLGETVRLACPMSGLPQPMITWTRGQDEIRDYEWDRLKPRQKHLRIERVIATDTGVYTCKGTNGFGSTEVRIKLIVIGEWNSLCVESGSCYRWER